MTDGLGVPELEDERDFLLASLADLERERAAGDLDDHDYAVLKDDYTARAARVLRALDAGRATEVASPARDRRRTVAGAALVVLLALVAGVLVAQSAGRREPGDIATGDIRRSTTEKLNQAGRLLSTDPAAAIAVYEEVLDAEPTNAEALTYKGWALTLSGRTSEGLSALLGAATANPRYPDVHAFLAIVFYRSGLVDEASRELDRLDALDPPAQIKDLTAGLRVKVEEIRSSTTSTTAGP